MTPNTWDAVPVTGIDFIDEEHRGLMAEISRLYDALAAEAPRAEVSACCQVLLRATETHFWHEERSMLATGFPRRAEHQRKHAHLRIILASFDRGLQSGQPLAPLDQQVAFLRDWLLDHIINDDQALADHLIAQSETVCAELSSEPQ